MIAVLTSLATASSTASSAAPALPVTPTLVLLALAALAVWLRRWRHRLPAGNGRLAVVERVALGRGKELCLVRIDDRELVLACSEHAVQAVDVRALPQAVATTAEERR